MLLFRMLTQRDQHDTVAYGQRFPGHGLDFLGIQIYRGIRQKHCIIYWYD